MITRPYRLVNLWQANSVWSWKATHWVCHIQPHWVCHIQPTHPGAPWAANQSSLKLCIWATCSHMYRTGPSYWWPTSVWCLEYATPLSFNEVICEQMILKSTAYNTVRGVRDTHYLPGVFCWRLHKDTIQCFESFITANRWPVNFI